MRTHLSLQQFTLALSRLPGVGPVTFQELLTAYAGIEPLYKAFQQGELSVDLSGALAKVELESILEQIEREQMQFVCCWESNYPQLLAQVSDPPPVLFYKGELEKIKWEQSIAIVGTRSADAAGRILTEEFTANLSRAGLTTISGMATGIDSFVHKSTLAAGGTTVAVLASAVSEPTPYSNYRLYEKVLDSGGVVLSENLPRQSYAKGAYLRRNRIIAGLSPVTLVVQAGSRSGAINTADHAFRYGRNVFAVPGSPGSKLHTGCNLLVKQLKAALVDSPQDVLAEYYSSSILRPVAEVSSQLPELEQQILSLLTAGPLTGAELIRRFDRTAASSLPLLAKLEIKGCIELADDGRYHVKSLFR